MIKIINPEIENLQSECVTDNITPKLSFALQSDKSNVTLVKTILTCGDWRFETILQHYIPITFKLAPFSQYEINIEAHDNYGEIAVSSCKFSTGRLDTPWQANWITDTSYKFTQKKVSPVPLTFKKEITFTKQIKSAKVYCTAIGIYELYLNNKKVGNQYFAPGFTSYKNQLQYQVYDVTNLLSGGNVLSAVVGGGWAVGAFTTKRKNRISAKRQAFLLELRVKYNDGSEQVIATDNSWSVSREGNFRYADFYDGEVYDSTINLDEINWKNAGTEKIKLKPKFLAQYGLSVKRQQLLTPINCFITNEDEIIYDFGQNFSGVICAKINGVHGQQIKFKHAEVLQNNQLFVKALRSAKATALYTCKNGQQEYSPSMTYMGFRYVGVSGINISNIQLSAYVLHSDFAEIGSFECSDSQINKLQSNIRWGGKSNFVDIPTDCPQRDEREGWTGDIAVFGSTAAFNFDMRRFFDKWLLDLKSEQGRGGGIPMVIPKQGNHWKTMATACWGDSCVMVAYDTFCAYGDIQLLLRQYPTIKKFLKAAKWWASFLSVGNANRYIWKLPFQFGDWCAPQLGYKQWLKRGKWVATAYFANSCNIAAKIAEILGQEKDKIYFLSLAEKISKAYSKVFTNGNGMLKKPFQTAYVLPLHFKMTAKNETYNMAKNLAELVKQGGDTLSTGFPATPYILFALADNGYANKAFDLLFQQKCPSWLNQVNAGATTIWERWDALKQDGTINMGENSADGGMVSFNHYANGAVGDFLYKRVAGLTAMQPGYKMFKVKPLLDKRLTYAKASFKSIYGQITISWRVAQNEFYLTVTVPINTSAQIELPNGQVVKVQSGVYSFNQPLNDTY